ncbi:hypothetical protein M0804_013261 [Polistes exclamans]|nr:hypothetical protein M0804_013261 [Polistes exclamans]
MNVLQWLNCFEYVAVREKVKDDEMVETLIQCLEPSVLMKMRESVESTNLSDLPYNNLVSLLEDLYSSRRGSDAADYRYLSRFQFPQENVPQFVLALRKLSSKCSPAFRSYEHLKVNFIYGLKDEKTRKILAKNESISFGLAVYFAHHMELSMNINYQIYNFLNKTF